MVGSAFPYSEFLPKEGKARGVQIDIDASMLSIRFPMEVGLVGDAAETLRALLPRLDQKLDREWRQSIARNLEVWWTTLEERAKQPATPINPQRVTWELSPQLPERVIVTSDSGSCANWYARDLKMRHGMKASLSGGLASMGAAVPYAIAAKYANPDRPVIALVGDGAMQMSNMAELITVAKYWRSWKDHRWIVCVFNNEDLNQVTWEQRIINGDPKFEASQQIPNVSFSRFAELIGLRGIYVDPRFTFFATISAKLSQHTRIRSSVIRVHWATEEATEQIEMPRSPRDDGLLLGLFLDHEPPLPHTGCAVVWLPSIGIPPRESGGMVCPS
jgi:pyruvate dehydrogenase (quinone)